MKLKLSDSLSPETVKGIRKEEFMKLLHDTYAALACMEMMATRRLSFDGNYLGSLVNMRANSKILTEELNQRLLPDPSPLFVFKPMTARLPSSGAALMAGLA
ncbi:TPA: hypothetical protein DCQ44_01450 [Candidatus Taylorbacteria bacterium]|nr:hypothetical protein [Candidatus Taylorbacteria bacterium]